MALFVNRMLNLKKIRLIGFDMDYTLVRYHIERFEELAFRSAARLLVKTKGYPPVLQDLPFELDRAMVGLVIDRHRGNLLKLNRYSKVKVAWHGLEPVDYRTVREIYENRAVELRDPDWMPLDTSFAISTGVLYAQVVRLKDQGLTLPDYRTLADDVGWAVDTAHRNGDIKRVVLADLDRYVLPDPGVAAMLERYKDHGKKLMVITNSDYAYTQALLDHAINPHLRHQKSWREVFDCVITLADKPRFFEQSSRFLAIDPDTGAMRNHEDSVATGIYQGGWFKKLQADMGLQGSEILYLGDHIYGDVVSIKRHCDWRTGLVLGDLEAEMAGVARARPHQATLDSLMEQKESIEARINTLDLDRYEGRPVDRKELDRLFDQADDLNARISEEINAYRQCFNPYWGELLRAGHEESRYADQIDKYACIYMTRVSDLYPLSPKTYFRPQRRLMPHEQIQEN